MTVMGKVSYKVEEEGVDKIVIKAKTVM